MTSSTDVDEARRHVLTPGEAEYVEHFSHIVQKATMAGDRTPQHGEENRGFTYQERYERRRGGIAAEVAVARVFGFGDWLPTDYMKAGEDYRYILDIEGIGGVKHADEHWKNMLVQNPGDRAGQDPPNIMYFLVTGTWDEGLWVRGWIFGFEAQRDEHRNDKPNVSAPFLVRREHLHPITPEVKWP